MYCLPPDACAALETLAGRSMRLAVNIQEGQAWIGAESASAEVPLQRLR